MRKQTKAPGAQEREATPGDDPIAIAIHALLGIYREGGRLPPPSTAAVAAIALNLLSAWQDVEQTLPHLDRETWGNLAKPLARVRKHVTALAVLIPPLLLGGRARSVDFFEVGIEIEYLAYLLVTEVAYQDRRWATYQGARLEADLGVPDMALSHLRRTVSEIVSLARGIQIQLTRLKPPERVTGAYRMREKREREKQGLLHRIPVSVYDTDLMLLRRFGLLSPADMGNREAIARALEAALSALYTEHLPYGVPDKERHQAVTKRLEAYHSALMQVRGLSIGGDETGDQGALGRDTESEESADPFKSNDAP